MNLKIVEGEYDINNFEPQKKGISKMKTKCLLITNIESFKNKNDIDKFWIKNQIERKKVFKEYLLNILI